jgi:hypothetical protein
LFGYVLFVPYATLGWRGVAGMAAAMAIAWAISRTHG